MRILSPKFVLTALIMLSFAGSLSPLPGDEPKAKSDSETLQGSWVCTATLKDGKPVQAYVGVKAVIEGNRMTWYFPQKDGSYREQKNTIRIDATRKPGHFDWWKDNSKSVDLRLYEITGPDEFRWATNLDYKTRPQSFKASRWQFTCKRTDKPK